MKHNVFSDITPYSLVDIHQLSATNRCFQFQNKLYHLENNSCRLIRNYGKCPLDCTVEHAKKRENIFRSLFYDAFSTA
jgi:hypothetical protein